MGHLEDFVNAAVQTIGWTTHVMTESDEYHLEDGVPIEFADESYQWEDLSNEVEADNREELVAFFEEHYADLLSLSADFGQHGHDYVLTAGGHGAGFWDRGYPKDIEAPITADARCGTSDHYVWVDSAGTLHYEN